MMMIVRAITCPNLMMIVRSISSLSHVEQPAISSSSSAPPSIRPPCPCKPQQTSQRRRHAPPLSAHTEPRGICKQAGGQEDPPPGSTATALQGDQAAAAAAVDADCPLQGRFMIPAAEVEQLLKDRPGMTMDQFLCSLIKPASRLAHSPISGFHVG